MRSPVPSVVSVTSSTPPALPPKQRSRTNSTKSSPPLTPTSTTSAVVETKPLPLSHVKTLPDLLEHTTTEIATPKSTENLKTDDEETNPCDIDLMEELDVTKYLVLKPSEEDGPDIRGGTVDALIIQATKATKNGGRVYFLVIGPQVHMSSLVTCIMYTYRKYYRSIHMCI